MAVHSGGVEQWLEVRADAVCVCSEVVIARVQRRKQHCSTAHVAGLWYSSVTNFGGLVAALGGDGVRALLKLFVFRA